MTETLVLEGPPPAVTLASRRAEVQARVDQLRAERGAAHLDGKPFDDGPLNAAVAELAALEDAASEAWRRDREKVDDADARRRAAARRKFAKIEKDRLAAIQAADEAAAQMVAAMLDAVKLAREAHRTAVQGLGRNVATLDRTQLIQRFSILLSARLQSLADNPASSYVGDLDLSVGRYTMAGKPWVEIERAAGTIPEGGETQ